MPKKEMKYIAFVKNGLDGEATKKGLCISAYQSSFLYYFLFSKTSGHLADWHLKSTTKTQRREKQLKIRVIVGYNKT